MNYRSQTLAAVIVTFNNVGTIERALESLRWVDELIVVDGGSTDGTLEIVRRFTKKIHFHPSDSQTVLRQFAFSLVKSDWVLSLNPHEWVEEMLRHEVDGVLLNVPEEVFGFSVPLKTYFMGQWVQKGGNLKRELRMFRKGNGTVVPDTKDALIVVPGEVEALERPIGREPYGNLDDIARVINQRSTHGAYKLLEAGGNLGWRASLFNVLMRPLWIFFYRYIVRLGFTQGFGGLVMALSQSYETFLKYTKFRTLCLRQV